MRLNFVLIPESEEILKSLIGMANKLSKGLNPSYLLKGTTELSIPHLSVIQFETEDRDNELNLFWDKAIGIWKKYSDKNYTCSLCSEVNYKQSSRGKYPNSIWAELLVDKSNSPWLQNFHDRLRNTLEIECLNAHGENWRPHFTLFNAYEAVNDNIRLKRKMYKSHEIEFSNFALKFALGEANDEWELVRLLHE